jgi:mRNA-degrading endonuclease RelE of RelBE toxin-antitoxin system
MVEVEYENAFKKAFEKIKDELLKIKIKKQLAKIIENPNVGKPMQYSRKGSREVYVSPFRLSYSYYPTKDKIFISELYHKDKQ